MMPPPPLNQKRRNVARGILLLARGRADGLAQFDATPQAVLQALAPLAAMLLVSLGFALVSRAPPALHIYLLAGAVGLLSQLVLSFEIAKRWGRAAEWYRFATAFCWCQWAAPVAMLGLILVMSVMLAIGVAEDTAAMAGLVGLVGYGAWLNWFLAWRALALTKTRALALVLIVNAATLVLINLPEWAAGQGG